MHIDLCGTRFDVSEQLFQRQIQSSSTVSDAEMKNSTLYIPVLYTVVWSKPEQNISSELIRMQHDSINLDFNAANPDIKKVPRKR